MISDNVELLGRVPLFAELSDGARRIAAWPSRARSRGACGSSTRATRATPATSSAAATFASPASTPTVARSRSRRSAPGDIFGELAMLDGGTRSASVETLSDCELLALPAADVRSLLADHAEITVKLVVALTRRLRETNERISRQSFQTVPSRVAGVLSQLIAEEAPPEGRDGHHDPDDPGRPRPARRHLARERQPLPRDARAGRGRARRARPGDGARAPPAARLHLLSGAEADATDFAAQRGQDGRAPAAPARNRRRAGARGDGGGARASASCPSASGAAPTTTRRCRSATTRRSRSRGSSRRSARRSRCSGDETRARDRHRLRLLGGGARPAGPARWSRSSASTSCAERRAKPSPSWESPTSR